MSILDRTITIKTLGFILIAGIVLTASFFVYVFGAIFGDCAVMIMACLLTLIGVPLLFISIFIKKVSWKNKGKLWGIGLLIIVMPGIADRAHTLYDDSFIRVNENSLELYDYQPFVVNGKAAALNEPSTLKFSASSANQSSQAKTGDYLPKLDGARALYPVYAAFGQAVYPKKEYDFDSEIGYHNTIDAYKKLVKREVDVIFVAAPSAEQLALAEEHQVEMKFTPIGKEAFVFFVNAKNPIDGLSGRQIRDIYSGKITNWKQVGGKNQAIQAFQRNAGSGSQTALINFMQGEQLITPIKDDVVTGMGGIIERTAVYTNYRDAIGFSFRYFTEKMIANNEIKLLEIDGVYPTIETIRSDAYPLSNVFYAVTLADNSEPNVEKLVSWILSPQGQFLIEKTGYVGIEGS